MDPKILQEAIVKRHADEIKSIASDIDSILDNEPKAKIKEDIFKNVFLPFFLGEENLYNVGLGNWETLASNGITGPGGLYREVDVVDENDVVLFTVPPIYDREAIKPVKLSDNIALEDLFKRAEIYGTIKPGLQAKGLSVIFTNLLDKMRVSENNSTSFIKRWLDIFERYGKLEAVSGKNNSSTESFDNNNSSSQYEIEDL